MKIDIYKNTNFGNNDLVWNVPHPDYDYSVHDKKTFNDIKIRFPLLTTRVVVKGDFDFSTDFYDYMIITDKEGTKDEVKTYYFINASVGDRNTLTFSVILDVVTTYNILSETISGVIVRKHDTNLDENRFDYPYALDVNGNFIEQKYQVVGYDLEDGNEYFIESTIDLTEVRPSVSIGTGSGQSIVVPQLPKPDHVTEYVVTAWSSITYKDENDAFTLYDRDNVDMDVLNTVRGLSGDGAISDSYSIPSEAVMVTKTGAKVTKLQSTFNSKTSSIKAENEVTGYSIKNEATKGIVNVTFMSLQEKTAVTFPAWDLKNSVDDDGYIKYNLWCDPKPSGAPYCCPQQVQTLHPNNTEGLNALATLEVKSVRGGQWLRSPLIYDTNRGEIFSTIETQLQREKADYDKKVALHQVELSRREQEIRIAQSDYSYQSGLATTALGMVGSVLSADFKGLFAEGKGLVDNVVSNNYKNQLKDLQIYEQEAEKMLINMAHSNNLKNLNVQEQIRRVTPREIVFQPNESLGNYEGYNGFAISISYPDRQTLIAKDMEFSKYGYPTYEPVEDFVILDHLRENHTVYQFESPLINIGGRIGDVIREILQGGIRVLSKKYSIDNILNNPKIEDEEL